MSDKNFNRKISPKGWYTKAQYAINVLKTPVHPDYDFCSEAEGSIPQSLRRSSKWFSNIITVVTYSFSLLHWGLRVCGYPGCSKPWYIWSWRATPAAETWALKWSERHKEWECPPTRSHKRKSSALLTVCARRGTEWQHTTYKSVWRSPEAPSSETTLPPRQCSQGPSTKQLCWKHHWWGVSRISHTRSHGWWGSTARPTRVCARVCIANQTTWQGRESGKDKMDCVGIFSWSFDLVLCTSCNLPLLPLPFHPQ